MNSVTIELEKAKETKNMVRYEPMPGDEERNRKATVPNLYVQQNVLKAAFGDFPKKIKIQISVG